MKPRLFTALARQAVGAQAGVSLIELMIAMVLGLLIMAGMIQLFSASKLTYNMTEGLARVQENARFSFEILTRDLRMAGAQPLCGGAEIPARSIDNWIDPSLGSVHELLNLNESVVGWEYAGTGASDSVSWPLESPSDSPSSWSNGDTSLPVYLRGRALPGSDVVALRSVGELDPDLTGCTNNNANSPSIGTCSRSNDGNPPSVSPGVGKAQPFMLVDCTAPKIDTCVQNASGNANVLNCSGKLNTRPNNGTWNPVYRDNLDLYWPQVVYYFVGESASGDRTALFRAANCYGSSGGDGCVLEELAEGVEALQAFYTVDGNNTLYAGDSLPGNNWNNVRSVSLHLLLAAPGPGDMRSVAQTYSLDSLTVNTDDAELRQLYSSPVAVRNKIEVR